MEQQTPRSRAKNTRSTTRKKAAPRRTKKQQGRVVFALDIGTRTVVGILAEKRDDGYKILAMETAEHDKRSMTDGQIEDIEAVAEVIKVVKAALEKKCSIRLKHVCIAAAGRALRTMRGKAIYNLPEKGAITAQHIKDAELEAVRETEEKFSENEGQNRSAFYCVGHSVIGLTLDGYKVTKPEGHHGMELETEIIAAFLPSYVVESLCAAVDLAGLDVSGLTLEPIAAMNAVVPPELRLINIALCDIGAGTSDVAVSDGGSVVAYGMATMAGDEITEELMKALLVDFNTAEKIKVSAESEMEYTDILLCPHTITAEERDAIIAPVEKTLAETICKEIVAANGGAPQAVFLVGGGSKLPNIPKLIAEGLDLHVGRVTVGRRELMRGINAPDSMGIGTEHATPLGIAITASTGVKYDFTTISLNGKKIRALDTNRLTVFELTSLAGFTPDKLIGKSGSSLSFIVNGNRELLRGTPMTPAEITVNGKAAALNTAVRKGDEVVIVPAQSGEDAVAFLADYFDMENTYRVDVEFFGSMQAAGNYLTIGEEIVTEDGEIQSGMDISSVVCDTLQKLCERNEISVEDVLLNGEKCPADTVLNDGDVITAAATEEEPAADAPVVDGVPITFNGMQTSVPMANGQQPIFLDLVAAVSDNPTQLLAHAGTITLNGRIARLDDKISAGDVIVIE